DLLAGEPRDLRGLPVGSSLTTPTPTRTSTSRSRPMSESLASTSTIDDESTAVSVVRAHGSKTMLLDPGMNLTLRPMRYPEFYERYRDAIKNTWTVEEVDLHSDLKDLQRLSDA